MGDESRRRSVSPREEKESPDDDSSPAGDKSYERPAIDRWRGGLPVKVCFSSSSPSYSPSSSPYFSLNRPSTIEIDCQRSISTVPTGSGQSASTNSKFFSLFFFSLPRLLPPEIGNRRLISGSNGADTTPIGDTAR
ncbi:hypothetical protein B296_00046488 [Ensete ventricosum]|uniref:Uncharacterized protein n=1 Tax=Ensete ventricosum TaxID=4639 RepID=A0A426XAL4_ENSVE|nr:hypothetical protein B296_00046488 [Ensete ventricosum]